MTEDDRSSTHPPLPPTTEEHRFDCLRLLRSRRVGPATYRRLLAEHGTAKAALAALPDIAAQSGVRDYKICPEGVVEAELNAAKAEGAALLFEGDTKFPQALRDIDDAPPLLWAIGDLSLLKRPTLALVGARNASSLGTRMAKKLAHDLGEAGFVIVSGLARGVDTAAHLAALETGTIAVQAGGVDILYPAENADLARMIGAKGLRLSDQPMGLQPQARHFVARNRIVSGLARGVVVVEAAAKSGSLITARTALDQGRDVLAVPAHPFEARAYGCNMLIRDGATLVRGADDVIDLLGDPAGTPDITAEDTRADAPELPFDHGEGQPPEDTDTTPTSLRTTALLHEDILSRLGSSPIPEDHLIRALGAAPTAIAPLLLDLEMDGKVIRQAGGMLARAV